MPRRPPTEPGVPISGTGLFEPAHPGRVDSPGQRGHGSGPLSARHAPPGKTLVRRPLPSTGITPLPRYYGPIRLPRALPSVLGIALFRGPRPQVGLTRGSPGFRALSVPACRRLRPWWTRVRSRPGERSLLPSPSWYTGRRPRCMGFRGLSRSVPRALRLSARRIPVYASPGQLPTRWRKTRSQRGRWLAPRPVGLSTPLTWRGSPTGKRRLRPAHTTSPFFPPMDGGIYALTPPPLSFPKREGGMAPGL